MSDIFFLSPSPSLLLLFSCCVIVDFYLPNGLNHLGSFAVSPEVDAFGAVLKLDAIFVGCDVHELL